MATMTLPTPKTISILIPFTITHLHAKFEDDPRRTAAGKAFTTKSLRRWTWRRQGQNHSTIKITILCRLQCRLQYFTKRPQIESTLTISKVSDLSSSFTKQRPVSTHAHDLSSSYHTSAHFFVVLINAMN